LIIILDISQIGYLKITKRLRAVSPKFKFKIFSSSLPELNFDSLDLINNRYQSRSILNKQFHSNQIVELDQLVKVDPNQSTSRSYQTKRLASFCWNSNYVKQKPSNVKKFRREYQKFFENSSSSSRLNHVTPSLPRVNYRTVKGKKGGFIYLLFLECSFLMFHF